MKENLVKLIGLYSVDTNPEVTLVELLICKKASEIEIGEFTQFVENQTRLNWQSPFSEKYLSLDGTEIIGDEDNLPDDLNETTRLIFFFYFLNLNKSLITPFGQLELTEKNNQPNRISELMKYESPQ